MFRTGFRPAALKKFCIKSYAELNFFNLFFINMQRELIPQKGIKMFICSRNIFVKKV